MWVSREHYSIHYIEEIGFTEITFKIEQISNLKYFCLSVTRYLILSIFFRVAFKNTNFWFYKVQVATQKSFRIRHQSSSSTEDSKLDITQSRYNILKLSIIYSSYKSFSYPIPGNFPLAKFCPQVSASTMFLRHLSSGDFVHLSLLLHFFPYSLLRLLNSNPCTSCLLLL